MIKKEDRAYLYFRQNKRGTVNITFGPEKFTKDTEVFSKLLFSGVFSSISFLSGLTLEGKNRELRNDQYSQLKLSFNAIVDECFPDIFEENRKRLLDEEEAIRRVDEGEFTLDEEFKEKIKEAKETIKERFPESHKLTLNEKSKMILKELESEIEELKTLTVSIKEMNEDNTLFKNKDLLSVLVFERLNKTLLNYEKVFDNTEEETEKA